MLQPKGRDFHGIDRRAPLREALVRHGQLGPAQAAGRFFPIACVALEVTQRCNLDCTLCYLSDHAELAKDVPIGILFDRIDGIASHYGPKTSVQITGGDPTLRHADDLATLCAYIRFRGMRSCLMTNGIRASRPLLARLARAGLARFFREPVDQVAFASFQMQADTGRGVLRRRGEVITAVQVIARLEAGFGTALHFGAVGCGHAGCNAHATALVAGGWATSRFGDRTLIARVIEALDRWFREDFGTDEARIIARLREVADPLLAAELAGRTRVDRYDYDWSLNEVREAAP